LICIEIAATANLSDVLWLYDLVRFSHTFGGDQGYKLSGTFAKVEARPPRLVLGWLTTKGERAL